jgi:hypothetical protein
MQVRFSQGELADDVIAAIIRKEPAPNKLTVVSSDHRIQEAARRRGCISWDSSDYIEWAMEREPVVPKPPPLPAKPDSSSPEDTAHWLREFEGIDKDEEVKRFNRPYKDFEKE